MYHILKRIFDFIFGLLGLLISLPVIIFFAILIRIESKGSPFFFQTRVGLNGKSFRIFKLRGMYIDSREKFPALYDYSVNKSLEFHFHYTDDPRVTKIGRYTRKLSIDELPNFFNVVLGDMSLVGPRPEIPDVLDMYGDKKGEYLSVKPGITCRSKVSGRDTLTKSETIALDLEYIRNRNFYEDIKILCKTFSQVVVRKNVF